MKKKVFLILIVVLVALLGWFLWGSGEDTDTSESEADTQNNQETATSTDTSESEDEEDEFPSDWAAFASDGWTNSWNFTLYKPDEVTANNPQPEIFSFKHIGPESEPNTEITDGFMVTIRGTSFSSTDYYVRSAEPTSETQDIDFIGYDATTYQTVTELGYNDYHVVFEIEGDGAGEDTVVDVSYATFGTSEAKEEYKDTIKTMLESLEFTEEDA